jgi:hypothetical protein
MTSRRRTYLVMMGACVVLFVSAWSWVRLVSTPAAVVLTVIALTLPPLAAIVANAGPGSPAGRPDERDDS